MSKRKRWAVSPEHTGGDLKYRNRFESKAAVYRWVENETRNWLCGAPRSPILVIYVDERDGEDWQTYERLDLRELAKIGLPECAL